MILGIDASNIRDGGGVTHLINFMSYLQPEKYEIKRVIVWGGTGLLDKLPTKPWLIRDYQIELDRSLLSRFFWQKFKLPRLIQKTCDFMFYPGGVASTKKSPYVTMNRNMLPFMPRERAYYGFSLMRLRLHLLEWLQKKSYQDAQGVIYLSEYARRQVNVAQKSEVIPHGVSNAHFSMRKNREKKAVFRFLYVSIVDVYKHHVEVIQAIAVLKSRGFDVRLDLIGPAYPPALQNMLTVLQQMDPESQFITYHGRVPHDTLASYYDKADAFIFASSCEAFGQIVTEAMAMGLPIACAYRAAMPEIVKDAALFFDPEDSQDIARQLTHLIENDSLRERLSQKAQARSQEYRWEQCADRTLDFIRRVSQTCVE